MIFEGIDWGGGLTLLAIMLGTLGILSYFSYWVVNKYIMVSDKFNNKKGIICEYNHWTSNNPNINPIPCFEKAEYIFYKKYYCKEHYDCQCETLAEMLR